MSSLQTEKTDLDHSQTLKGLSRGKIQYFRLLRGLDGLPVWNKGYKLFCAVCHQYLTWKTSYSNRNLLKVFLSLTKAARVRYVMGSKVNIKKGLKNSMSGTLTVIGLHQGSIRTPQCRHHDNKDKRLSTITEIFTAHYWHTWSLTLVNTERTSQPIKSASAKRAKK